MDPRIHFALVCGARGCPPVTPSPTPNTTTLYPNECFLQVRVYSPANVDKALQRATIGTLILVVVLTY